MEVVKGVFPTRGPEIALLVEISLEVAILGGHESIGTNIELSAVQK